MKTPTDNKSANAAFTGAPCSAEMAELLFAIEAALPFVKSHVGHRMCSSSGGPVALEAILRKYQWNKQRWKWVFPPNGAGKPPAPEELETKEPANVVKLPAP